MAEEDVSGKGAPSAAMLELTASSMAAGGRMVLAGESRRGREKQEGESGEEGVGPLHMHGKVASWRPCKQRGRHATCSA